MSLSWKSYLLFLLFSTAFKVNPTLSGRVLHKGCFVLSLLSIIFPPLCVLTTVQLYDGLCVQRDIVLKLQMTLSFTWKAWISFIKHIGWGVYNFNLVWSWVWSGLDFRCIETLFTFEFSLLWCILSRIFTESLVSYFIFPER